MPVFLSGERAVPVFGFGAGDLAMTMQSRDGCGRLLIQEVAPGPVGRRLDPEAAAAVHASAAGMMVFTSPEAVSAVIEALTQVRTLMVRGGPPA